MTGASAASCRENESLGMGVLYDGGESSWAGRVHVASGDAQINGVVKWNRRGWADGVTGERAAGLVAPGMAAGLHLSRWVCDHASLGDLTAWRGKKQQGASRHGWQRGHTARGGRETGSLGMGVRCDGGREKTMPSKHTPSCGELLNSTVCWTMDLFSYQPERVMSSLSMCHSPR